MRTLLFFTGIIFLLVGCKPDATFKRTPVETITVDDNTVEVYDFENFKPFLNQHDDTVYVFNFWATWCKPCVEELPAFVALHQKYSNQMVKVVLVSLDFPTKIKEQLIPFIQQKKLKPEVIVLDDPDQNTWIPQVSEKWSGAIPATLIYSKNKREFFEGSLTFEKLEHLVLSFKK